MGKCHWRGLDKGELIEHALKNVWGTRAVDRSEGGDEPANGDLFAAHREEFDASLGSHKKEELFGQMRSHRGTKRGGHAAAPRDDGQPRGTARQSSVVCTISARQLAAFVVAGRAGVVDGCGCD